MIDSTCTCGQPLSAPESKINTTITCPGCKARIRPVSGEPLSDGQGAGDFDARLSITEGPDHAGDVFLLGGVMDIEIGKLPDKTISIPGHLVSRLHCKLSRVDFGPSRWKLIDNKSTNGIFVNGTRVTEHELSSGDEVQVGDYAFKYETDVAPPPPPPPPPPKARGTVMPQAMAPAGGTLAYAGAMPPGVIGPRHFGPAAQRQSGGSDKNWMTLLAGGLFIGPLLLIIAGRLVPAMSPVSLGAAYLGGFALMIWGSIGLLYVAFTESTACGLLCMFVPFYSLYYVFTRLEDTKAFLLRWFLGWMLVFGAGMMLASSEEALGPMPDGLPRPMVLGMSSRLCGFSLIDGVQR